MAEEETGPQSIAEVVEEGGEDDGFDYVPPIEHDKQLRFSNIGGPNPRSAMVKVKAGQVPIEGVLDADATVLLLVEAEVTKAEVIHERGPNGEVIMNSLVQHIRPKRITRFQPPEDASGAE